jgi:hypothetical protein
MLLEVMLALALVVVVGLLVLGAVSRSTDALRAARERQVAVDLARSAMAKLEAGIESSTTLNGPVKAWAEGMNLAEVSEEGDETGWELIVETEPTTFDGLTYVTITARRERYNVASVDTGAGAGESYTLRQLVRIAEKAEEGIGEKDDVMIEAERARERRRFDSERDEGGNP